MGGAESPADTHRPEREREGTPRAEGLSPPSTRRKGISDNVDHQALLALLGNGQQRDEAVVHLLVGQQVLAAQTPGTDADTKGLFEHKADGRHVRLDQNGRDLQAGAPGHLLEYGHNAILAYAGLEKEFVEPRVERAQGRMGQSAKGRLHEVEAKEPGLVLNGQSREREALGAAVAFNEQFHGQ